MTGLKETEIKGLELDLTGTCNLSCPLCMRSYSGAQHLVKKNVLPVSEWIEIIDRFPNIEQVVLAGIISEPTMYANLFCLLEHLVKRNISIELNTNGNTHKPDWWEELGNILTSKDRVMFTVCGSTQELHEKYRVGSNLQQILDHATAYRKNGKNNDCIQHISFDYNTDDLKTSEMQKIINQFSHKRLISSLPYQERFDILDQDTDIKMINELSSKYNRIKKVSKLKKGKKCSMRCKSLDTKFLAIDNFGRITPCFLHRMHTDDNFDYNDYSKILKFDYDFCYECESMTALLIESNGMERMA